MTVTRVSRPIEVGGTAYRWTLRRPIRHRGHGWTLLTFVVEQDTGRGELLVVTLPAGEPVGPGERPVPPSTVAEGITRALVAGWRPAPRGPVLRCRSRTPHGRHELRGGPAVRPVRRAGHRRCD
jgi:hypothetical protein